MPILPTSGSHKDRLKRIQQFNADPFDPKFEHQALPSDLVLKDAAKLKKPPKSDDGTDMYKKRKSWSDSSSTGRH